MTEQKSTMSAEEFELAIDELVKGMTQLHNRLLRIEKWMLRIDEEKKRRKLSLLTKEKQR